MARGPYDNMPVAIDGLAYGLNPRIECPIAKQDIAFGVAVFGPIGVENVAYPAHQDQALIVLDADLVASNVITTVINGTTVATTFATSHAATMTAHIAALNAKAEFVALGITFTAGDTNRKIVARVVGLDLTCTTVVTLGGSQAGVTITLSEWLSFLGVAGFTQMGGRSYGSGTAKFFAGQAVNVLTLGEIWVPTPSAVTDKSKAYVILAAGADQGKFTMTSTNNFDADLHFRSNTDTGRALLGVRAGIKP